jgi:hypothetical protein
MEKEEVKQMEMRLLDRFLLEKELKIIILEGGEISRAKKIQRMLQEFD